MPLAICYKWDYKNMTKAETPRSLLLPAACSPFTGAAVIHLPITPDDTQTPTHTNSINHKQHD